MHDEGVNAHQSPTAQLYVRLTMHTVSIPEVVVMSCQSCTGCEVCAGASMSASKTFNA